MASDKECLNSALDHMENTGEFAGKKMFGFQLKNCLLLLLFSTAAGALVLPDCPAQELQRVLIYTGGHDFERETFFDIFQDMPATDYQELIHPQASPVFDSALIEQFDVLLFYDMVQEIKDAQKAAFIRILERGKGLVFLHHSLVSYQDWEEFERIIGGRYVLDEENQDNSTYRHDVDVPVTLMDKDHPVTRGLKDFIIHDEVYGNFRVQPGVRPLLKTTHPESGEIIGWTNHYGNSRIVYIQPGHDHFAYENPNYRRLLKQAIDWVQNKEIPMIKYSPEFEFRDGLYLNMDKVRTNDPLPLGRIVTELNNYNRDFFEDMITNEEIILYDDFGVLTSIKTKDIWGYAQNGRLYIMLGGKFQRLNIEGSISHFIASATTYEKSPDSRRDSSAYYSTTQDIYRSFHTKPSYLNVSAEGKVSLYDFESNSLVGYDPEALGKLLQRDSCLSAEYNSLRKREKKKRMVEFIRRYNKNHPLYFPQ
ncbi:MAG: ThuA domain-containing protein [Bacteroidales bacterium]|nr:ThuA domain-containing protein [Bacteroidales bacterium]